MEIIGKLANAPAPDTFWSGVGQRQLSLYQMNVHISMKFICEFKLVPDQPAIKSFKLTLRKSFSSLSRGSL